MTVKRTSTSGISNGVLWSREIGGFLHGFSAGRLERRQANSTVTRSVVAGPEPSFLQLAEVVAEISPVVSLIECRLVKPNSTVAAVDVDESSDDAMDNRRRPLFSMTNALNAAASRPRARADQVVVLFRASCHEH